MKIGGSVDHGRPSRFWPGAIAHVVAYQRALPAQEVIDLLGATLPGGGPPAWDGDAALEALRGTWDYRFTSPRPSTWPHCSRRSRCGRRGSGTP